MWRLGVCQVGAFSRQYAGQVMAWSRLRQVWTGGGGPFDPFGYQQAKADLSPDGGEQEV